MQEDRVCRGSLLGGEHEEYQQHGIENRRDSRDPVQTKTFMSGEKGNGKDRKERATKGKLETRERDPLDKQTAGAPEQRCGKNEE